MPEQTSFQHSKGGGAAKRGCAWSFVDIAGDDWLDECQRFGRMTQLNVRATCMEKSDEQEPNELDELEESNLNAPSGASTAAPFLCLCVLLQLLAL